MTKHYFQNKAVGTFRVINDFNQKLKTKLLKINKKTESFS